MIKSGFFNSLNGDRKYNADDFNTFFEGLISKKGIFRNVGNAFSVVAGGGLTVNVNTGKAIVNNYFVKNDAIETLTIETPHAIYDRYDAVILSWTLAKRSVELRIVTGTPQEIPEKYTPDRLLNMYDIVLAYIRVPANATQITNANITDTRYNTNLCGMIEVLLDQVDTGELYNEYLTAFDELKKDLEKWEQQQKTQFETWFNALTEELQVNTYIERVIANYTVTDERYYIQLPEELNYTTSDILEVFINGVLYVEGTDYNIQENEVEGGYMLRFTESLQGSTATTQVITIYDYKSKIGFNTTT